MKWLRRNALRLLIAAGAALLALGYVPEACICAGSLLPRLSPILSILGALGIVLKKLIAPTSAVGWYSMMVAICFFSGLIMLFLGLIGEYLGRMYMAQSNHPQYVVRCVYEGEDPEKRGDLT